MRFWVYTIYDRRGTGAPPRTWLEDPRPGGHGGWGHHRTEMWFPQTKPPRAISAGDRALFYGSRERGFIGAVEVIDHEPRTSSEYPRDSEQESRFPWVLRHRLLASKAADDNVASAESAGINPQRILRGPHTEVTQAEYERGIDALVEAARATAKPE